MRSVVVALASLIIVGCSPLVQAQEAPVFTYVQPDAAGDVAPNANAKWADITSLSAVVGDDGAITFEMKFVDLAQVTGNQRYCLFFKVGGTAYQTGAKFGAVAGTYVSNIQALTACTWTDRGTTVGTPTLDIANDRILVVIAPDAVPELAESAVLTEIRMEAGYVVPVAGQGDNDFFDVLTPSVEPVDFAVGAVAAATETFALEAPESVDAVAGSDATIAVNVTNLGASEADYELSVEGLDANLSAAFDAGAGVLGAGNSTIVNLTITIPADFAPGSYPVTITVAGPLGGNTTTNSTLEITAAPASSDAVSTASGSPSATNSTDNSSASANEVEDANGVPSPSVWFPVFALVAVAAALRRRN